MNYSLTQNQIARLQECFTLAQDPLQQEQATAQFHQFLAELAPEASATDLTEHLWKEIIAARRSAAFWHQISDVEKTMSDRLAQQHFQLKQNHLRLMQEQ